MTPKPVSVRIATPADEAGVFHLAVMAHKENGVASIAPDKVTDKIRSLVNNKRGIIGIVPGPKEPEAIIMMQMDQQWYSDEWYLSELFAFVHPNYRQSSHAKDIIDFGKWAAEAMNMSLIMGVLSNERTKAKVRLYRRKIKLGGALFIHNHKKFNEVGNDTI